MANPNFQCLVFIIVYSVVKIKVTNTNNSNTPEELHENDDFGTYIKNLIPTINQRNDTITILANCILKKDLLNTSVNTKTIELFKYANNSLEALPELLEMNITKFNDLNDLFNKIHSQFTAPKKIIFTYGHGSVFGIFAQTQAIAADSNKFNSITKKWIYKEPVTNDIANAFTTNNLPEFKFQEQYIGYENDNITLTDLTTDMNRLLSNEELAGAIRNSFGKVDILIMNNCLMQNVYAQTAFQDVVDYLIAPQSGITYPGFNLQNMYDSFKPNIDNSQIAEKIVRFFDTSNDEVTKGYLIVAYKLDKYSSVLSVLQKLGAYLQQKLENPLLSYKSKIANSLAIEPLPFDQSISSGISMYDIFQWTKQLLIKDTSESLKSIISDLESYIQSAKINNHLFIGEEVNIVKKKGQNPLVYSKENISGLCVYFPKNLQSKNSIIEAVYDKKDNFENAIKWSQIVDLYTSQTSKEIDHIKNNIPFVWINRPV